MQDLIKTHPEYFPLFFIGIWMAVTTILGFFSGWFSNMNEFPDRETPLLLSIRVRSASMGIGVSMNNVVAIDVCRGGIRFRMFRVFGPFCRPFFVPWQAMRVERKTSYFFPSVVLSFGQNGNIRINPLVADRLAAAAKQDWPEKHAPPALSPSQVKKHYFLRWLLPSAFASAFFIIAPRIVAPNPAQRPPVLVAVLFPAIVIGVVTLISYFNDTKK